MCASFHVQTSGANGISLDGRSALTNTAASASYRFDSRRNCPVFEQLQGIYKLIALLLYGTGMRLMECLTLRIMDVDFGRQEITIREGKGGKDRRTVLPLSLVAPLKQQIEEARVFHDVGRANNRPGVMLSDSADQHCV